jgi:hypothetical protein
VSLETAGPLTLLFGLLKSTLGDNDKVETAVGECLRTQQANFYCNRNFKLKPRFDKLSLYQYQTVMTGWWNK